MQFSKQLDHNDSVGSIRNGVGDMGWGCMLMKLVLRLQLTIFSNSTIPSGRSFYNMNIKHDSNDMNIFLLKIFH